MTAEKLKDLRSHCNVTQAEFAEWMGVPFRTYQDLEGGKSEVRPIHMNAARYAVIQLAAVADSGVKLPDDVADVVNTARRFSAERGNIPGLASGVRVAIEPLPTNFK